MCRQQVAISTAMRIKVSTNLTRKLIKPIVCVPTGQQDPVYQLVKLK